MKLKQSFYTIVFLFMVVFYSQPISATIQPGDTLLPNLASLQQKQKVTYLLNILETTKGLPIQKAIEYAEEGLVWAVEHESISDEARVLNFLGNSYYNIGNYDQALNYYQKALHLVLRMGKKTEVSNVMQKIGIVYFNCY